MANTNYEEWNNSELADALTSNDRFVDEELGHLTEEEQENVEVWQWDRSDLIDYAHQYLT